MERVIAFDTEQFYDTKNGVSVRDLGTWWYHRHPQTSSYMISVCDGSEAWAGHPKDFNFESLRGATLLSHNASHDQQALERLKEDGLCPKDLEIPQWHCTANMGVYLTGCRSLDQVYPALYPGEEVDKSTRARADGKTWGDIQTEGWAGEMIKYALSDAHKPWRMWTEHNHRWPDIEKQLSAHTSLIRARGVAIDTEKVARYLEVIGNLAIAVGDRIPWLKGGDKPTSSKAMAQECRRLGIPCPPVKSHDEEAFDAWEREYQDRYPWVGAVADWRKLTKMKGELEKIRGRIRADGTFPFGLKYAGAHTLRWSGDEGINMQNPRKEPLIVLNTMELLRDRRKIAQFIECHEETGVWPAEVYCALDIRSVYVARPGKKLIICDKSQIEPRVLAWLAGDHAFLQRIREGLPVYEAHARATMGWTGGSLKKENPKKYSLAKARVLGLGYGCGKDRFVDVAWTMARLEVSLEESAQIVEEYRAQNPLLTNRDESAGPLGLWHRLDRDFRDSVGGDYVIELPSGQKMVYRDVQRTKRVEMVEEINPATGESRKVPKSTTNFTAKVYDSKTQRLQRKKLYGGLLTENATQRVAREAFAEDILRLEVTGYPVLWHTHDEAITEVDPDVPVTEIERLMSITPDWLPGCPVASEGVESHYYKK